jgi:6-phosphogluconate dehydrogenase
MEIGLIGLGRMGANMARRLINGGHHLTVFNRTSAVSRQFAEETGSKAVFSLPDLVASLTVPRAVWVMVPAGAATEAMLNDVVALLSPGDIIIDGGNTYYKDDIRRAEALKPTGIHYVDVGTSGGVWGITEGYSLMIGGEPEPVEHLRPVFETLAPSPDKGWGHVGSHGAGHFVKMVHNGIEYGMMQALAEGFEIMHAKKDYGFDLEQIAKLWQYGSVVRSWLLDLTVIALAGDQDLSNVQPWVADSGEGRWTVFESIDLDVPAPIITLSLQQRFISRQEDSYSAKLLAEMRNQFGGHAIKLK